MIIWDESGFPIGSDGNLTDEDKRQLARHDEEVECCRKKYILQTESFGVAKEYNNGR